MMAMMAAMMAPAVVPTMMAVMFVAGLRFDWPEHQRSDGSENQE
jgi:hypothetical protein